MPQLEKKYRVQSLVQFALAAALLIIINVLANTWYGALDLTEDQRFTLTENTREQLVALENPITVRVLLEGDLPASYQRLRTVVEETLEDFGSYTDNLEIDFADPLQGRPEDVQARQQAMLKDGIVPVTDYQQTAGERITKAIYPYILLYYGDRQRIISLLETARPDVPISQQLNQAESLLEYKLSRGIDALTNNDKPLIGFTFGNGELPGPNFADLYQELSKDYSVEPVFLDSFPAVPAEVKLLIVAKPTVPFSDFQAFKLDQYVMNGGKVIWAIDGVAMDFDSLQATGEAYPQTRETGLENLFFKYGFRLGNQLVLDLANTPIPIATNQAQSGAKFNLVPWPYHALGLPASDNPIVQNIDAVDLRYPTLIELPGEDPQVKITPLLASSDNARRQRLPSPIDLDVAKFNVDLDRFNESGLPLAVLLEGTFQSPYANRLSRENEQLVTQNGFSYQATSQPTSMIVISDGDVLANAYNARTNKLTPLGVNQWSKIPYANKTFMLNAIEYLLNPNGIITSRGKQVKLRLLDQNRAVAEAGYWRTLNLVVPLLLLAVFGFVFNFLRRRRYGRRA